MSGKWRRQHWLPEDGGKHCLLGPLLQMLLLLLLLLGLLLRRLLRRHLPRVRWR